MRAPSSLAPVVTGAVEDQVPQFPTERPGERYERHPGDVLRLAVWATITVALVVVLETAARTTRALDGDVADWVESVPAAIRQLGRATVGVFAFAAPVVVVIVLVAVRRWRRLITIGATALVATAAYALLGALTGLTEQAIVVDEVEVPLPWAGHASPPGFAAAVAVAMVARPWAPNSWRWAGGWLLVVLAAATVLSSLSSGVELLLAVAVGNIAAGLVLVIVGAPNHRPAPAAVGAALAEAGIDVVDLSLHRAVAGRAQLYRATTSIGKRVFVKVYGEDARDADRLYRTARSLAVRGPSAFARTARGQAEREALLLFAADEAGVRCPSVRTITAVEGGSTALVLTDVSGCQLDELPAEELTGSVLVAVWREVARLHGAGLAHGALRTQNVLVTVDGPAFVGLASGDVCADGRARVLDRAELLASLTALVGPSAAVTAAAEVLPPMDLAGAMPYLQPLALSHRTRRAVTRGDLEQLRGSIADVTSRDLPPLVRLARVRVRSLVMMLMLAGAFYALLPQLANVDDSVAALRSADWSWLVLALLLSALTYLFSAIGLMGGVAAPLPFARTVRAQVASSFVNRVTPANVGGMALNVRYMQRAGIGAAEAVTGMGLNVVAGALVHAGLLVVFVTWAGQRPGAAFSLPDASTALIVLTVVLVVVGLVAATRRGRRLLRSHVLDFGRQTLTSLLLVVRSPGRLAALMGGSLGVTAAYATAFACSVQAFGGGVGIPEVGAVYLGAAAIAAVAPTPGGLGAMEAALVAGLTAAGQDPALALAAVLSYRVATYWLPILPGWLAFRHLERHGAI